LEAFGFSGIPGLEASEHFQIIVTALKKKQCVERR